MKRRKVIEMRPMHIRCRNGVTHAMHGGWPACGEKTVAGCTVTTMDPIDCMTCLSRGIKSDTVSGVVFGKNVFKE